jgi:Na+-driven multidrug efflux pump
MTSEISFIRKIYDKSMFASVLGLVGSNAGQIVGTMIAGNRLSSESLSVIGLALPIYYAFCVLGAVIGVGGTVISSKRIGERNYEQAKGILTLCLLFTVLFGIVFGGIIFIFAEPLAIWLGATPAILPDVVAYIRIMAIGGLGIMLIYPPYNFLRLDGKNFAVPIVFFTVAIINIVLDFVLIETMGVAGIALATVIASGAGGLLGTYLLLFKSQNFGFAKPAEVKNVLDIFISGSPGAMEYFGILLCSLVLNKYLSDQFGSDALGMYKIVDSLNNVALCIIWGISGALVSFAGVFFAERDTQSLRQLLKLAFKRGLIATLLLTILCEIFAAQTATIFGTREAANAIRIFCLSLPMSMINNIIVYIYLSNKRVKLANILLLVKLFAGVVLFGILFSEVFGEIGIWHGFWTAELLTFICAIILSNLVRRKNNNLSPLFLINLSSEKNGAYTAFSVLNTNESISACTEGVSNFTEDNGISPKKTMQISLALEELLVVSNEHSKPSNTNVRILIYDDLIIIRLRCIGKKFNPLEYAQNYEDDMDVMGIKMVLKFSISLDYQETFGVNNTTIVLEK